MLNPDIWLESFAQILFSLSIGLTITIAYASYLPDDNNITKSALTVAIANSGFEVFHSSRSIQYIRIYEYNKWITN